MAGTTPCLWFLFPAPGRSLGHVPFLVQLPSVGGQLPSVRGQLPSVRSQLPSVRSQLPSVGSQLPSVGSQLPSVRSPLMSAGGTSVMGQVPWLHCCPSTVLTVIFSVAIHTSMPSLITRTTPGIVLLSGYTCCADTCGSQGQGCRAKREIYCPSSIPDPLQCLQHS